MTTGATPVPRRAFFASAAKGSEGALRDELRELGLPGVRAERGGVGFQATAAEARRVCFESRIAVRVLEPLASFACADGDELYAAVHELDLCSALDAERTLAVSAACRDSRLTHTQFIAQRTKDAVVDRQRARGGARSSVDREDPDVRLFVHLVRDQATLYLDWSGEPLHRRGYRLQGGTAPLKENLAAALLRLAGFRPDRPFLDPMCGSGTLLLEAALWAEGRAPGLLRERFGFERWASFGDGERRAMQELRQAARERIGAAAAPLAGSDADPAALEAARANAARAGVRVELRQASLGEVSPGAPGGALVTNPPYGRRIAGAPDLGRELARLVDRSADQHVGLLLAREQLLARTRRKPRAFPLYNGDIECVLRVYTPLAG